MAMLLTTAFVGCRQDPLAEDGNAIRFSVESAAIIDMQTKAGAELPTEADFKSKDITLFGIRTKGTGTETMFDGGTVLKFDGTDWKYSPLRYWSQSSSYDFRAVSPAGSDVSGSAAKTGSVTASFGSDKDLMVASNHTVSAYSIVPLTFSHACAAVLFLFKNPVDSPEIQITHFEVNNMYSDGTMSYSWDANLGIDIITWTPSEEKDAWLSTDTPLTLSGTYQSIDGWHLVVPQTLGLGNVGNAKLSFSYTVEGESDTKYAVLSIPDGHNKWEPGKTYKYQIDIDIQTIGLSFTVDSWDTNVVEGSYTIRR